MNIYNQTVPYFYIIRNKETGTMYAGSKWAEGCHPDTFMIPEGYCTSSPTINYIIEESGLDVFEILRIDTYCDGLHVHDYETIFLQTNNCSNSDNWYNGHNNQGKMSWNTPAYKKLMILKYGVDHNSKIPEIKEKKRTKQLDRSEEEKHIIKNKTKQTNLEKYGYEYNFQDEKTKNAIKQTNLEKYGYEFSSQSPTVKEKIRQTNLEKYGTIFHKEKSLETLQENYGRDYTNPSQIPEIKEKKKKTYMENWGFEYATQSPKIKEKTKQTSIIKYGYDSPSKSPAVKEKVRQTNAEKYGTEYYIQSKEGKEKLKTSLKEKYGVDNISKLPFLSIIETRKTYAKNILSRYFPEFKRYY